jgi:hypothetical protein
MIAVSNHPAGMNGLTHEMPDSIQITQVMINLNSARLEPFAEELCPDANHIRALVNGHLV